MDFMCWTTFSNVIAHYWPFCHRYQKCVCARYQVKPSLSTKCKCKRWNKNNEEKIKHLNKLRHTKVYSTWHCFDFVIFNFKLEHSTFDPYSHSSDKISYIWITGLMLYNERVQQQSGQPHSRIMNGNLIENNLALNSGTEPRSNKEQ